MTEFRSERPPKAKEKECKLAHSSLGRREGGFRAIQERTINSEMTQPSNCLVYVVDSSSSQILVAKKKFRWLHETDPPLSRPDYE